MTVTGFATYLQGNSALVLLLICHFLSDFHLQTPKIAQEKNTELRYLGYHLIGVAVPLILVGFMLPELWLLLMITALSHAIIDYAKPRVRQVLGLSHPAIFAVDQVFHLLIIIWLSQLVAEPGLPTWLPASFLNLVLFFLLITKPANITFRIFFSKYQPMQEEEAETIQGAGAVIGLLERIVTGICIAFGQFSSIGLVFTAKSIARYNRIAENPAFAEYYLIGSLFSILSVLLAAWICLL